jgi:hypothetical protein
VQLCVGLGDRGDACLVSEDLLAEAIARPRRRPPPPENGSGKDWAEEEEGGVLVISDDAETAVALVRRAAGGRRVASSLDLAAMVAERLAQSAGSSPVRPNLIGLLSATVDQVRGRRLRHRVRAPGGCEIPAVAVILSASQGRMTPWSARGASLTRTARVLGERQTAGRRAMGLAGGRL